MRRATKGIQTSAAEQWAAFVRMKVLRGATKRREVFVIEPSQQRIEELKRIAGERESVEEFIARGGQVERLHGVESRPLGRGIPVRMHMSVGSRAE